MDNQVTFTLKGKKYNQFRQELIPCRLCDGLTPMMGTKLCDPCWELETRIRHNPELARKILKGMME